MRNHKRMINTYALEVVLNMSLWKYITIPSHGLLIQILQWFLGAEELSNVLQDNYKYFQPLSEVCQLHFSKAMTRKSMFKHCTMPSGENLSLVKNINSIKCLQSLV